MLNLLRLPLILFRETVSTTYEIFNSEAFRGVVLTLWVIISVLVLLFLSIKIIFSDGWVGVILGIVSALFSLVPVFVYYDLRRNYD